MLEFNVRQTTEGDALRVQELRKLGWRDNYENPETGVTREILETRLAKLPVEQGDINYFINTLQKPNNKGKNLVAEIHGKVVGTVFYETLDNGNGYIGVFIEKNYRGQGIGTSLLQELVKITDNTLEVIIFSKNRSKKLYERVGFVEEGQEQKHYFEDNIYLPTQRLVLRRK